MGICSTTKSARLLGVRTTIVFSTLIRGALILGPWAAFTYIIAVWMFDLADRVPVPYDRIGGLVLCWGISSVFPALILVRKSRPRAHEIALFLVTMIFAVFLYALVIGVM